MSEDPIEFAAGDVTLDRYVGNGPTNAIDPDGLEPFRSVHATTPNNAVAVIANGLNPGLDGLLWSSSVEAAGSGASVEATVHLRYNFSSTQLTDIPKSVECGVLKSAFRSLKDSSLTGGARGKAFGRAVGDYIANWIKDNEGQ